LIAAIRKPATFAQFLLRRPKKAAWAVETEPEPRLSVNRGKASVAELAETSMMGLSRVLGGASFARGMPFGQWAQDVKALGFLRPPWGLAFDQLFGLEFPEAG